MSSDHPEEEPAMLDPADAEEEIPSDADEPMDSDDDEPVEIQLQNDSVAHFDTHTDSIFSIAQHPKHPEIVATGGGDDVAYVFDATPPPPPVLPASYQSDPQAARDGIQPLVKLDGHTDSVSAIAFTLPDGDFLITAGLDGQLRAWKSGEGEQRDPRKWSLAGTAQEVEEINWLAPSPHPDHPNTIALGASDGSVWVYEVTADESNPLSIVQAYYLHTAACSAGTWSPNGSLLATVSEDGSLYVWDVFGDAAAAGLNPPSGGQALVGLTAADERFRAEGGLFSVAISPGGALVAVGGGDGQVHVVSLPRLGNSAGTTGGKGAGQKSKAGGKQMGSATGQGQAGQILASLHTQSESVESISFAQPPLTLMATGSVDGSIALFDPAHRYAVRRHIREAHEGEAVIKVEFVTSAAADAGWLLTSCGNDGVVRRWDTRGASGPAAEWRGHVGEDGGGVLGFVQGDNLVVTAGDDAVSLVFATS